MPKLKTAITVIVIAALYAALDYSSARTATLMRVVDGDTVHILLEGEKHKVRLYGIDTPERQQVHGAAAGAELKALLNTNQITIRTRDKDRYGRMVATIYVEGKNVNTAMVRNGHAWWYRGYAQFNAPLAWAEFNARREKLGLWSATDPTEPWEWRRRQRASSAR